MGDSIHPAQGVMCGQRGAEPCATATPEPIRPAHRGAPVETATGTPVETATGTPVEMVSNTVLPGVTS